MKYLLYYSVNNDFVSDQVRAGGDGSNVVSVVDGVAWSNDIEKAYYRYANNKSENLTSYTLTVHYIDPLSEAIALDDIISVDAYVGKSANVVIVARKFPGYETDIETVNLTLSSDTEYTFRYSFSDLSRSPLCFNILTSGTIRWNSNVGVTSKSISYSADYGKTWTTISSSTVGSLINVNAGGKIFFIGHNSNYGNANGHYSYFSSQGATFEIEGNIMSLVAGLSFSSGTALYASAFTSMFANCTGLTSAEGLVFKKATIDNCYAGMFRGCTSLTTAPALPATGLTESCYGGMFNGCTSLTIAPVLPATRLGRNCYNAMFRDCTSLTTAPLLRATTLASSCYTCMFQGCTSLTTAPELPATTLAESCYYYMFDGCTSLTSAPELPATTLAQNCYTSMFSGCIGLTSAPELPATTLAQYCYRYMFYGCTSLITAPELPATTLTAHCYRSMFGNCTNLNYIKCLATYISATQCTTSWLDNVSSTGTFVKNPNMSSWTTGNDGIPNNWTVEDAS